jgi:glucose/arabinose dehydrogenase
MRTSFLSLLAVVTLTVSCLQPANVTAAPVLKPFAEGFTAPTALVELPDGSGRMLLADQVGTIHVIEKDGKVRGDLFLDVSSKLIKLNQGFDERGLLGLALHPKFNDNGMFYVYLSVPRNDSTPADWDHRNRISEFKADPKTAKADLASERVLLEFDHPFFNHDGGCLVFGPDGFLYIAIGDGGNADDSQRRYKPEIGNGQNTDVVLGKILRLDVDKPAGGKPYGIPSDNPFVKGGGLPEIYAYGLRNPWRISFDRGGQRQLFAADIGQTLYEEVNIIEKGGNYGWFIREAFVDFNPKDARTPKESTTKAGFKGEPLLDPIITYKNTNRYPRDPEAYGISITGGYVYRGKALPGLTGKYVFADWCGNVAIRGGQMLVAAPSADGKSPWKVEKLALEGFPTGKIKGNITAFGEDNAGELYVLVNEKEGLQGPVGSSGKVYKLTGR